MKRFAAVALLCVLAAAGVGVTGAQDKPLKKAVYTITTLEGSTAGLQQIAAGNVNFATVGAEVAMIAREKGIKVKSFYVINQPTIFRVVVPKDSAIQKIADFKGKTIGVSALASGAVPVARALVASGALDPDKDVQSLAVGVGAPAGVANAQKKGIYKAQGLIQGTFEAKDVFANQFIDEINRGDQAAVVRQAKEYR